MFENKTEQQAKEEILKMVEEYCNTYHNQKKSISGRRQNSLCIPVYMTVQRW